MKYNHLDKPHLCAVGYGCMALVPGGRLACDGCDARLTDEERAAVASTWMQPGFDALVDVLIERHRHAEGSAP